MDCTTGKSAVACADCATSGAAVAATPSLRTSRRDRSKLPGPCMRHSRKVWVTTYRSSRESPVSDSRLAVANTSRFVYPPRWRLSLSGFIHAGLAVLRLNDRDKALDVSVSYDL